MSIPSQGIYRITSDPPKNGTVLLSNLAKDMTESIMVSEFCERLEEMGFEILVKYPFLLTRDTRIDGRTLKNYKANLELTIGQIMSATLLGENLQKRLVQYALDALSYAEQKHSQR